MQHPLRRDGGAGLGPRALDHGLDRARKDGGHRRTTGRRVLHGRGGQARLGRGGRGWCVVAWLCMWVGGWVGVLPRSDQHSSGPPCPCSPTPPTGRWCRDAHPPPPPPPTPPHPHPHTWRVTEFLFFLPTCDHSSEPPSLPLRSTLAATGAWATLSPYNQASRGSTIPVCVCVCASHGSQPDFE